MEDIIKKAIEGGYERTDKNYFAPMGRFDCDAIVLDPLFWQALGKACDKEEWENSITHKSLWLDNALQFHEINLIEGWDKAIEYLTNLIK